MRRACQTSIATLLIAALWPSTLWILGSFLAGGSTSPGDFPQALGKSLQVGAAVLFPLLFVRQICRRKGLGESHFGWSAAALQNIRRQLNGLIAIGTPLAIVVAALEVQATDAWKDSLGRILFIGGQLLLASLAFTAFRPVGKSLKNRLSLRHTSWIKRLSNIAVLSLPVVPLALAYLAAAGYYDTALRLTCRFEATAWLVLSFVLFQALATRWVDRFLEQMSLAIAEPEADDSSLDNLEVPPAAVPASSAAQHSQPADAELAKIDRQAHRLLRSAVVLGSAIGLMFIWSSMFPALKALNEIGLWPTVDSAGNTIEITLANLLESIVVGIVTFIAAANLPSLLQILVLKRLPLDNGVRFALATVVRYVIAIIGLTWAGASIGIGWPKMQWLVAAISFGLGFGLQEIFANFVSGLIVLWERPIRIGDTVTVGDVTGVVSRIQMRATTILDADRKELIVPNKEFITARLVNWTLSDSVIRLVVPVGLTYGSDTRQAQRLSMRVASEIPTVLKTPPAKAVFMGFGEKTLNFELRVFVGNVDQLMSTRHQLNMSIDRTFRAAGIDIAIPLPSAARLSAVCAEPAPQEKAA